MAPLDLDDAVGPDGIDPPQPPDPLGGAIATSGDATEGSPPFVMRRLSLDQWPAYIAGYPFTWQLPSRVVLHHTAIPTEAQWRGLDSMRAMQRSYAGKGWTSSPHLYCAPDGIWLAAPLNRIGIHAGAGNGSLREGWYSIGLEMVGDFDQRRPEGRTWAHTVAVLAGLRARIGRPLADILSFHRDYSTKSCPGTAVNREWVLGEVVTATVAAPTERYRVVSTALVREAPDSRAPVAWGGTCVLPVGMEIDLAPAGPTWRHWPPGGFVPVSAVVPGATPFYTEYSPILASPPVNLARLVDAVYLRCQRAGSPYAGEPADPIRRRIVPTYAAVCARAGVDVYLALAQLGHETGWLTSALSRREDRDGNPLRNPAGIGVTGETSPAPAPGFVWDADRRQYRAGVGFRDWQREAVLAHVGRLVAWATDPDRRTLEQRALVDLALGFRPLALRHHGSAPTLRSLGATHNLSGAGWADPGETYGQFLAVKADALRRDAS